MRSERKRDLDCAVKATKFLLSTTFSSQLHLDDDAESHLATRATWVFRNILGDPAFMNYTS
jgi:hypothetical protein